MAKVKIEVKNSVLQDGVHYVTSDYKTRNPKRKDHKGMDLVGKNGLDEIVAIADGIVTISTYSSSAGYYVQIKHNNGYTTRYLHMKKGSINNIMRFKNLIIISIYPINKLPAIIRTKNTSPYFI